MKINSISWQRVNNALHRDLGYLCCALIILYAISGVAVNHVADWNPNYSTQAEQVSVGVLEGLDLDAIESHIVSSLGLDPRQVKGRHLPSPGKFVLFLPEGGEVRVAVKTGLGTWMRVKRRSLLFESNVLHLNHLKGVWTYIADIFSLALIVLAVTGLFILKGPKGITGRGKWLAGAGTLLPLGFIVYYYLVRG
ncbi:MAG: PepSY-associated TM helix domain-containing protein [Elusimicrobiota bacterium]|nr:PepSY-associated TM helix domain-containing protein [Elusimicrobiota bacterium]